MASADKIETTVVKTEIVLKLTEAEAKTLYALTSAVGGLSEICNVNGALEEIFGNPDPECFDDVFYMTHGDYGHEIYPLAEES